ncbi:MAG TPA: hypothetical protein VFD27_16755 [Chthoniobacteraceae bacterium]|jgi:hypothetical protein|nr:hypothetical protein [Chthoniobacteraceae bacterium]
MGERTRFICAHSNPLRKEGNHHIMKYLAIITLAALALGLGACSHHESAPPPPPASSGYHK